MFGMAGVKVDVSFLQERIRHLETMQEAQRKLLLQHQKLLEDLVHFVAPRNGLGGK